MPTHRYERLPQHVYWLGRSIAADESAAFTDRTASQVCCVSSELWSLGQILPEALFVKLLLCVGSSHPQAEATFYGTPRVEAFQLEGSVAGVDLLPLTAAATATQPAQGQTAGSSPSSMIDPAPAMVDGSPVRLKVTGGLKLSAVRDNSDAARRQAGLAPAVAADKGGYLFTGEVTEAVVGVGYQVMVLARLSVGACFTHVMLSSVPAILMSTHCKQRLLVSNAEDPGIFRQCPTSAV